MGILALFSQYTYKEYRQVIIGLCCCPICEKTALIRINHRQKQTVRNWALIPVINDKKTKRKKRVFWRFSHNTHIKDTAEF